MSYKHKTSLKKHLSFAQGEMLPCRLLGSSRDLFVFSHWLRDLSLSAIADRFELRCQSKVTDALLLEIFPYHARETNRFQGLNFEMVTIEAYL